VLTTLQAMKNKHLFSKIFLTGHSLGGALAHHALIDFVRVKKNLIKTYLLERIHS